MLKFAREHVHLSVQGQKIWKMAEAAGVTSHSWQSMQNRYRRHLMRGRPSAFTIPTETPSMPVAEPLALTNGSPPRSREDQDALASSSGIPARPGLFEDAARGRADDQEAGQRERSRSAHGGASSSSDMATPHARARPGGRPPTYRHRFKSSPGMRSRLSSPNGSRLTPKRSTQMPPDMSTPVQKNEDHSYMQLLSTGKKTARISSPSPKEHYCDLSARGPSGQSGSNIMKLLGNQPCGDLSSSLNQDARAVESLAGVRDCAKLARCHCRGAFDVRHTMPKWLVMDQYRSIRPCDVDIADANGASCT